MEKIVLALRVGTEVLTLDKHFESIPGLALTKVPAEWRWVLEPAGSTSAHRWLPEGGPAQQCVHSAPYFSVTVSVPKIALT